MKKISLLPDYLKLKTNEFLTYTEFENLPLLKIIVSMLYSILYAVFTSWVTIMVRVPQLVWELISFKGFILFYIYFITKNGLNLESVLGFLGAVSAMGVKTWKDGKYKKRQEIK